MNSLEDQIGETEPTVIAPWNWVELQRESYRRQRWLNARELCELVGAAVLFALLAWII